MDSARPTPIDLNLINEIIVHTDKEVIELTPELVKIFISHKPEDFPVILTEIARRIEEFGIERLSQIFLFVNRLIITGTFKYKNLSQNLQDFMSGSYYCLERLAEFYPEWGEHQKKLQQGLDKQIVEVYGLTIDRIYKTAVAELGNPPIPESIMRDTIQGMIFRLGIMLSPYKLNDQLDVAERYQEMLQTFPEHTRNYIKSAVERIKK